MSYAGTGTSYTCIAAFCMSTPCTHRKLAALSLPGRCRSTEPCINTDGSMGIECGEALYGADPNQPLLEDCFRKEQKGDFDLLHGGKNVF